MTASLTEWTEKKDSTKTALVGAIQKFSTEDGAVALTENNR